MGMVIRNARIEYDTWQPCDVDGCRKGVPEGDVIVPLACLEAVHAERRGRLGVLLAPTDDPAALAPHFVRLALVAVSFPSFADGRGYSIARRLRDEFGYRGELRAVGEVLRDQLFYLARCGFDAFVLRADQNVPAALGAFADFSDAYQGAVDQPLPLLRRRNAA